MRRLLWLSPVVVIAALLALVTPRAVIAQLNRVGVVTSTINNIVTTSTDGITLQNGTLATSGTTVQMSPRFKLRGTAWDTAASETVDFFMENLPTSAATPLGTFKLGYSLNGGAATYPLSLTSVGTLSVANFLVSGSTIYPTGIARTAIFSSADRLLAVTDTTGATGQEMNSGSATLGTCTAGTITTGSHNFAGGYTGNTSGSCVINFGTPNWTNAPFCVAMSIASTTHPRVSAVSTSSMTITGGVSGEAITYLCAGRIGT